MSVFDLAVLWNFNKILLNRGPNHGPVNRAWKNPQLDPKFNNSAWEMNNYGSDHKDKQLDTLKSRPHKSRWENHPVRHSGERNPTLKSCIRESHLNERRKYQHNPKCSRRLNEYRHQFVRPHGKTRPRDSRFLERDTSSSSSPSSSSGENIIDVEKWNYRSLDKKYNEIFGTERAKDTDKKYEKVTFEKSKLNLSTCTNTSVVSMDLGTDDEDSNNNKNKVNEQHQRNREGPNKKKKTQEIKETTENKNNFDTKSHTETLKSPTGTSPTYNIGVKPTYKSELNLSTCTNTSVVSMDLGTDDEDSNNNKNKVNEQHQRNREGPNKKKKTQEIKETTENKNNFDTKSHTETLKSPTGTSPTYNIGVKPTYKPGLNDPRLKIPKKIIRPIPTDSVLTSNGVCVATDPRKKDVKADRSKTSPLILRLPSFWWLWRKRQRMPRRTAKKPKSCDKIPIQAKSRRIKRKASVCCSNLNELRKYRAKESVKNLLRYCCHVVIKKGECNNGPLEEVSYGDIQLLIDTRKSYLSLMKPKNVQEKIDAEPKEVEKTKKPREEIEKTKKPKEVEKTKKLREEVEKTKKPPENSKPSKETTPEPKRKAGRPRGSICRKKVVMTKQPVRKPNIDKNSLKKLITPSSLKSRIRSSFQNIYKITKDEIVESDVKVNQLKRGPFKRKLVDVTSETKTKKIREESPSVSSPTNQPTKKELHHMPSLDELETPVSANVVATNGPSKGSEVSEEDISFSIDAIKDIVNGNEEYSLHISESATTNFEKMSSEELIKTLSDTIDSITYESASSRTVGQGRSLLSIGNTSTEDGVLAGDTEQPEKNHDDLAGEPRKPEKNPGVLAGDTEQPKNYGIPSGDNQKPTKNPGVFAGDTQKHKTNPGILSGDNQKTKKNPGILSEDNQKPKKNPGNLSGDTQKPEKNSGVLAGDITQQPKTIPGILSGDIQKPEKTPGVLARDTLKHKNNPGIPFGDNQKPKKNPGVLAGVTQKPKTNPGIHSGENQTPKKNPGILSGDNPKHKKNPGVLAGHTEQLEKNPGALNGDTEQPKNNPSITSGDNQKPKKNPGDLAGDTQQPESNPDIVSGDTQKPEENPGVLAGNTKLSKNNPGILFRHTQKPVNNPGVFVGNTKLPKNNPGILSGDTQKPGINSGVFAGDTKLPRNNPVILSGDIQKPENNTGVFAGDTKLPRNNPVILSGDIQKPENNPGVFAGDTKLPKNNPGILSGDNQKPENNTGVLAGDTKLPKNNPGILSGDTLKPEKNPGVPAGDTEQPKNYPGVLSNGEKVPDGSDADVSSDLHDEEDEDEGTEILIQVRVTENPEVKEEIEDPPILRVDLFEVQQPGIKTEEQRESTPPAEDREQSVKGVAGNAEEATATPPDAIVRETNAIPIKEVAPTGYVQPGKTCTMETSNFFVPLRGHGVASVSVLPASVTSVRVADESLKTLENREMNSVIFNKTKETPRCQTFKAPASRPHAWPRKQVETVSKDLNLAVPNRTEPVGPRKQVATVSKGLNLAGPNRTEPGGPRKQVETVSKGLNLAGPNRTEAVVGPLPDGNRTANVAAGLDLRMPALATIPTQEKTMSLSEVGHKMYKIVNSFILMNYRMTYVHDNLLAMRAMFDLEHDIASLQGTAVKVRMIFGQGLLNCLRNMPPNVRQPNVLFNSFMDYLAQMIQNPKSKPLMCRFVWELVSAYSDEYEASETLRSFKAFVENDFRAQQTIPGRNMTSEQYVNVRSQICKYLRMLKTINISRNVAETPCDQGRNPAPNTHAASGELPGSIKPRKAVPVAKPNGTSFPNVPQPQPHCKDVCYLPRVPPNVQNQLDAARIRNPQVPVPPSTLRERAPLAPNVNPFEQRVYMEKMLANQRLLENMNKHASNMMRNVNDAQSQYRNIPATSELLEALRKPINAQKTKRNEINPIPAKGGKCRRLNDETSVAVENRNNANAVLGYVNRSPTGLYVNSSGNLGRPTDVVMKAVNPFEIPPNPSGVIPSNMQPILPTYDASLRNAFSQHLYSTTERCSPMKTPSCPYPTPPLSIGSHNLSPASTRGDSPSMTHVENNLFAPSQNDAGTVQRTASSETVTQKTHNIRIRGNSIQTTRAENDPSAPSQNDAVTVQRTPSPKAAAESIAQKTQVKISTSVGPQDFGSSLQTRLDSPHMNTAENNPPPEQNDAGTVQRTPSSETASEPAVQKTQVKISPSVGPREFEYSHHIRHPSIKIETSSTSINNFGLRDQRASSSVETSSPEKESRGSSLKTASEPIAQKTQVKISPSIGPQEFEYSHEIRHPSIKIETGPTSTNTSGFREESATRIGSDATNSPDKDSSDPSGTETVDLVERLYSPISDTSSLGEPSESFEMKDDIVIDDHSVEILDDDPAADEHVKANCSGESLFSEKALALKEEADEIIDLTWLDDDEIKEEVLENQEERPCHLRVASLLILQNRMCLCGQVAEYLCSCNTVMYCSEDCQFRDWTNHQMVCPSAVSLRMEN